MQESWHRYLRLGIVHFMAFPSVLRGEGPFVDTLRQIAQDEFFTAVETGWVHSDAERAAAAALLRESHVSVGFGAQSALLVTKSNLNALDESERKKAVALVQQCIDQAAQLGARRVAVLNGPYPGPSDEARATRLLVESLLDLCAYGRGRGIGITLETFDRTIEKKALAGPTRLCVGVSEAVRRDFPDWTSATSPCWRKGSGSASPSGGSTWSMRTSATASCAIGPTRRTGTSTPGSASREARTIRRRSWSFSGSCSTSAFSEARSARSSASRSNPRRARPRKA